MKCYIFGRSSFETCYTRREIRVCKRRNKLWTPRPWIGTSITDLSGSRGGIRTQTVSLSAKNEPTDRPNPSINPPKIVQAPLEPAIAESLSALVEEMKASRREQRIIEKRWWPPSASWAIVYVTVLFMTVAAFQIRALVRQARIAAQTLAAIRKHLAVSDRAKIPYEPIIQSMKLHKFGQPDFCVTYQIMNTGRTEAHVFEQQSLVWWDDGSRRPRTVNRVFSLSITTSLLASRVQPQPNQFSAYRMKKGAKSPATDYKSMSAVASDTATLAQNIAPSLLVVVNRQPRRESLSWLANPVTAW